MTGVFSLVVERENCFTLPRDRHRIGLSLISYSSLGLGANTQLKRVLVDRHGMSANWPFLRIRNDLCGAQAIRCFLGVSMPSSDS